MGRKTLVWIIGALFFAASPALAGKKNGTKGTKAKVTICHIPPGNPDNQRTISVADAAVAAHLAHGDVLGACGTGPVDDPVVDPVVIEADAGADVIVVEGDVVEVVGAATILSGDYDGDLVFEWTQVGGNPVDYESTSPPLFVDTTGAFGDLVFRLTVSTLDGSVSDSDEFTVTVESLTVESPCESVVTSLGVFEGFSLSLATGINDFGQVAGYCKTAGVPASFLWENGVMTSIGPLGWNAAETINSSGTVPVRVKGDVAATLYEGGALVTLGKPAGSYNLRVFAVNDLGVAAGWASFNSGLHAVTWENHEPTAVFRIGGFNNTVIDNINNRGDMALRATNGSMLFTPRAFFMRDGVFTDLGVLDGYLYTYPKGINDTGQVVGFVNNDFRNRRAFLWQDGVMADLGTLGGSKSGAEGINEAGDVVGWAHTADAETRAFIWQNGVMTDLNDLLAPECGWVLSGATDINNVGQIVGVGFHNGETRAFLLTLP